MSRFHGPKHERPEVERHLNWMAGGSYDIKDPINVLRIAASSCFFGEPQYYSRDKDDKRQVRGPLVPQRLTEAEVDRLRHDLDALDPREWRSLTPAQAMESAIDKALDHDAEATLKEAVRLRQEEHIRTTPQVILVRAAHHPKVKGTGLVRMYASKILSRADEPSVGLAYHVWRYGKACPIPNSLKRAWADKLSSTPEEYLAKYRMGDREVKTVDVVNLCHPKGDAVGKLVKGELSNEGKTWEAIVSKGGSNKETWLEAMEVMGHMALLRNLRNLSQNGVDPKVIRPKLVAGVRGGKQLPFRYYSAYKALQGQAEPYLLDGVEECLMSSLDNLTKLSGRTMSLCDNSGSAHGATTSAMGTMKVATIANLTGVVAAMISDEGHVGVFGDELKTLQVRKREPLLRQLDEVERLGTQVGGSTENGIWLFWDKAIKERQRWDNVFVFSDMQAGHGGLYGRNPSAYREYLWGGGGPHIDVTKLVNAYRKAVNPNVNVFLVQVAGYQDTIMPEFYKRTYVLGGWGEGLLRFAAEMAKL